MILALLAPCSTIWATGKLYLTLILITDQINAAFVTLLLALTFDGVVYSIFITKIFFFSQKENMQQDGNYTANLTLKIMNIILL